jgi:ribosomal protein S18 acetylase RimI-like enzyme/diaminopimelate epimerase
MRTNETPIEAELELVKVFKLDNLDEFTRQSVVDTYSRAFVEEPYNESFTPEEVDARLRFILEQQGDLLLGKLNGKIASFAGGYERPKGEYYIEELAVAPEYQRQGLGRKTLESLLSEAAKRGPKRLEIRTTAGNSRAIALYESEGFTAETGAEIVAQRRQGGAIDVDERLYFSKPPLDDVGRLAALKRVAIAYPSGNTTAIVFDQLLNADRKALNDGLMHAWKAANGSQPEIEQCGFVTRARDPRAVVRVEMFGGEFCGNATRSAAWLVTAGQDYEGLIEVSGASELLWFQVKDGCVAVEMPIPRDDNLSRTVDEGTLIQLDGIAQIVVDDPSRLADRRPRQLLDDLLRENKYDLANQPAVGVSYYDRASLKAKFCVWVKEMATIFDETACGSGTCAIGVAAAIAESASVRLAVIQPSGETISTEAEFGSGTRSVAKSLIYGSVTVLYDGRLTLS